MAARQRVLNTVELLEHIIARLDFPTLHQARQVSQLWRSLVDTSAEIGPLLFKSEEVFFHQIWPPWRSNFSVPELEYGYHLFPVSSAPAGSQSIVKAHSYLFNPLTRKGLVRDLRLREVRQLLLQADKSILEAFATQPRTRRIEVKTAADGTEVYESEKGARVGEILRLAFEKLSAVKEDEILFVTMLDVVWEGHEGVEKARKRASGAEVEEVYHTRRWNGAQMI